MPRSTDRMYANDETPLPPTLKKPPASWWLATTIGVSAFNGLALWGILAALQDPDPRWVCVLAVLALEYVGFRVWGDRHGLGRGWALVGPALAVAVCVVIAAVVTVIAIVSLTVLCDGDCSFS